MKVLKLTVRVDAYIEADLNNDQAIDLAVNAVEVRSSDKDVELEIETIEIEKEED